MFKFLEDIKAYLEDCFANDSDFSSSKKPKVYSAYQVSHEPTKSQPEIQVRVLDESETINYRSFCKPNADSNPLQFDAYSPQIKIGGTMYNSQDASHILKDKVVFYLNEYFFKNKNSNILFARKVGSSPSLPMNDDGSIYVTSVRYSVDIAYPYEVG